MLKRTCLTVISIFLFLLPVEAQRSRKGNLKVPISFGYAPTSILSNTYTINVESGLITPKFGWSIGLFKYTKFIMWELNYFQTKYKSDIPSLIFPEDVSLRLHGLEVGAALIVIPKSKYITPVIGVSWQTSALGVGGSEKDESFVPFNADTSNFLWKAGVLLKVNGKLHFLFNYKQSLPDSAEFNFDDFLKPNINFTDKKRAIKQLSVSMLFNFNIPYTVQSR